MMQPRTRRGAPGAKRHRDHDEAAQASPDDSSSRDRHLDATPFLYPAHNNAPFLRRCHDHQAACLPANPRKLLTLDFLWLASPNHMPEEVGAVCQLLDRFYTPVLIIARHLSRRQHERPLRAPVLRVAGNPTGVTDR